jgi:hypothetical protein
MGKLDAKNTKMKKLLYIIFLIFASQYANAHIGGSGVQMQGQAGPYNILVNVKPPDVIPGTAKVSVFIETDVVFSIDARPIYLRSGDKGAPTPDRLQPVAGQLGQYEGEIWLMETGSSSAQILVSGEKGKGELIVPVMAISTAQRQMPGWLGTVLGILGILLFTLMIAIIGASVSDGLLPAGETLSKAKKRKKYINMALASVICAVILYGGSSWWNSWADEYQRYLYKPLRGQASIISKNDQSIFQIKIDTADWASQKRGNMLSTLIPDHGKLMHAFLLRIPGLDAFAHIHPERKDSTTFEVSLPSLPAGKYLMYADVVRYSGFGETITDTIIIKEQPKRIAGDQAVANEDTYVVTDPINAPGNVAMDADVVICGKPGTKTVFQDGSYAVWEGKQDQELEAEKAYQLNFGIFNPDGSSCQPEPYLGMMGHAVVVSADGSVYIHLHPSGSFPMAAEKVFKNRLTDTTKLIKRPASAIFKDSIDSYLTRLKNMSTLEREEFLMTEMGMYEPNDQGMVGMDHSSLISFPYAFPKEGRYRIFLQVKRNEKILTGAFDVKVKKPVQL